MASGSSPVRPPFDAPITRWISHAPEKSDTAGGEDSEADRAAEQANPNMSDRMPARSALISGQLAAKMVEPPARAASLVQAGGSYVRFDFHADHVRQH